MGAGASLSQFGSRGDVEAVKSLCGEHFDQSKFDELKDAEGFVTREQIDQILAAHRSSNSPPGKAKYSCHADFKRAAAQWQVPEGILDLEKWADDTFVKRLIRAQAAIRRVAVRKRIQADLQVLRVLETAENAWSQSHADLRPPQLGEGDAEKIDTLRQQYLAGEAVPGVCNPYAHASPGPWAKASFHAHTSEGAILRAEKETTAIVEECKGFSLVGLVANDATSEVSEEATQLGAELGVHLMGGSELLFESGVGPHFGFFHDHPELSMAYHPSMGVPLDRPLEESCPAELFFMEEMRGIHFFEVANCYVRLLDPEPVGKYTWRADEKWDSLLSDGCLVWGVGNGDAYQGIRSGMLGRCPTRIQTEMGLGYNFLCVPPDSTKTQLLDAFRAGCLYFSTGVEIIDIQVQGTVITVETTNANRVVATTDNGVFLAQEFGTKLTFDPWECLAQQKVPIEQATYVRVTCTSIGYHNDPKTTGDQRSFHEYAWTQPFWLTLNSFSLARDRRGLTVEKSKAAQNCGSLKKSYAGRFRETFDLRHQVVDVA